MFDVFSSTWFAAIYLLLFISLVGCLVPRTRLHVRALRSRPPKVPRSLARLPVSESWQATDGQVLDRCEDVLRGWRTVRRDNELSAEKGYLRETGNLVFHLSLVLLLIGIAIGAFRGFKGMVLVVEGHGFSNTVALFDDVQPGRNFSAGSLVPFTVALDDFRATYAPDGKALTFDAHVHWHRPGQAPTPYDIRVNHPLVVGGAKTYLIGHGYAPHIVVRDRDGRVIDNRDLPCLPQNPQFLSTCVVKEPFTAGTQVGFTGVFTPTTVADPDGRVGSRSPAHRLPGRPRPRQRHPAVGLLPRHLGDAAGRRGHGARPAARADVPAAERGVTDLHRHRAVGDLPGHPGPGQAAGADGRGRDRRRPPALAVHPPAPDLGAGHHRRRRDYGGSRRLGTNRCRSLRGRVRGARQPDEERRCLTRVSASWATACC